MSEPAAATAASSGGAPDARLDADSDPIIIDLGKVKRKQVKALKQGQGPLLDEIAGVVAQVREGLGGEADGKTILPVVVLYRQRPKRKKISSLLRL